MIPEQGLAHVEPAWGKLSKHAVTTSGRHLSELFDADSRRFDSLSVRACGLLADFSKQRITAETMDLLLELAAERRLGEWIRAFFSGEPVNCTEGRSAMHWRLRNPDAEQAPEVHAQLARMDSIVTRIQDGHWRGIMGDPISDVLNIGVGGSELGPLMASVALQDVQPERGHRPRLHFISSMDGSQVSRVLSDLDPRTTLVVVSSKSFTTVDTLANAATARQWLSRALGGENDAMMRCHFLGVSANAERMTEWGILAENQLCFWEWVGGRYSMCSAIGLPVALTVGMPAFREMLAGAHEMDEHFRTQPWQENMPLLMGLIDVWNINFLGIPARAVLPYDGRLKHWPAYLEQLEMESNGKSVSRDGQALPYDTCPVIWGEVGPNAQHAFYQLLHQGTQPVSCEFLMTARRYSEPAHSGAAKELEAQHVMANANCLAQSRLLALGEAALPDHQALPHYKHYRGNQPSTTLVLDELSPRTLGALVALYEHKVFVEAVIWGINPFDQWGVEMGKVLATDLTDMFKGAVGKPLDDSTRGLIDHIRVPGSSGQVE